MIGFKNSADQMKKQNDFFGNEIENMTEVERLEFEIDWIYTEIERLETESRKVRLKLSELKGERSRSRRTPLTRREEKENN